MLEIALAWALGASPLLVMAAVRFYWSVVTYSQRVGDEAEYY
jgi:hypothetical protein